jgi:hypothetical protein
MTGKKIYLDFFFKSLAEEFLNDWQKKNGQRY